MGFSFSAALNPFDPENPATTGNDLGGKLVGKEISTLFADPLDLFGQRAREARESVSSTLLGSTERGLDIQREQLSELESLNAPFRTEALEGALPSLLALATGEGESGFKPSRLFELQKDLGQRTIRRRAAASGKFGSTQRQEEEADLVSGLSREDLDRFERGKLAQLQIGIGSTEALNAAGNTLGTAGSALLSNLGAGQRQAAEAFGAQRQASLQGAASGLSGLASLLNQ